MPRAKPFSPVLCRDCGQAKRIRCRGLCHDCYGLSLELTAEQLERLIAEQLPTMDPTELKSGPRPRLRPGEPVEISVKRDWMLELILRSEGGFTDAVRQADRFLRESSLKVVRVSASKDQHQVTVVVQRNGRSLTKVFVSRPVRKRKWKGKK